MFAIFLLGLLSAGAVESDWTAGTRVVVEKDGTGHRAIILQGGADRCLVAFEGEEESFDEWVEVARIRTVKPRLAGPAAPGVGPTAVPAPSAEGTAPPASGPMVEYFTLSAAPALPRVAAGAALVTAWLEPQVRLNAGEPQRFNEAKLAQAVFAQPAVGGIPSARMPHHPVLLPGRAGAAMGFAAIEGGDVALYRRDAAGQWARSGQLDTTVFGAHRLTHLVSGDLNADGETDLVVLGGPVLQVYFGTADGRQVPAARPYRSRQPLNGAALGRFFSGANPAGIAVVEGKDYLRLLSASAAGITPAGAGFPVKFDRVLVLVAGDFDGDGFSDLAITTETQGRSTGAWMFFNQHSASQPFLWPVGGKDDFARALFVADLDRDGRDDLILTDNDADRGEHVRVVFGSDGRSGWEDPWDLIGSEFGVGLGTASVVVADFNRDGRRDIGVAGRNGLRIYSGADYRRFSRNPAWPVMQGGGGFPEHRAFVAADFDGDGAVDLLGCTPAFATGYNLVLNATPVETPGVYVPVPQRRKAPVQAGSTENQVIPSGDAPPGTPVLQFLASRAEPYGPYRYRIVVEVAAFDDGIVQGVTGVCQYDSGGPLEEVTSIGTRRGDTQWAVEVVLPRGRIYTFTLAARDDRGHTSPPLRIVVNP